MTNQPSTAAKILYRPVGLVSSVVGGLLAGVIFKQVWRRAAPGPRSDPPGFLTPNGFDPIAASPA